MLERTQKSWGRLCLGLALTLAAGAAAAQASGYHVLVGANQYAGYRTANSPHGGSQTSTAASEITLHTKHDLFSLGQLKVFVPPGTRGLQIVYSTFAADEEAKAAARFGSPPVSTGFDVAPDTSGLDTRATLRRLLAGEELTFYSPERSGALQLATYELLGGTFQSTVGGYVYVNMMGMPGGKILNLVTQVAVNKDCYQRWFDNADWDSNGNPREGASHTCSGSSSDPDPVTDALRSFEFSEDSLVVGRANAAAVISPVPAAAALPQCTVPSNSPLEVVGNRVTLKAGVAEYLATTTVVVVTCGQFMQTIQVIPAALAARVALQDRTEADGTLALRLTLDQPAQEVPQGSRGSVWVGVYIPPGALGPAETFFFRTPSGWAEMAGPNINNYALSLDHVASPTQVFDVLLGIKADDLRGFGAQIFFGYKNSLGRFVNLGRVW